MSKLAQEAVAQFWAEDLRLPTILARLNVVYGDNGGLPAMLLERMKAGQPIPLGPHGATRAAPIHHDDLFDQLPGLIAGATVPATIVNWAGDEPVPMQELCAYMGRLTGCEPRFVVTQHLVQGEQAFLAWEFHFRMRRWRPRAAQCIRGATLLRFDAQSRVALHRDYWDAAEELYEKLPLLGALMRWLRKAASATHKTAP